MATEPNADKHRPPLSVIVPTNHPWPAIASALDALIPQAAECGAEIVVVDGDGDALEGEFPSCVRYVAAPGCDVFELRAIGIVAATGHIVAITEDHCVPQGNYCHAIQRAHTENPQALVAGAILNGSTDRAIDRANYFIVHAGNLPPRPPVPDPSWVPTPSNLSYKRTVLPTTQPAGGWLETVLNPTLLVGGEVSIDDGIVVTHVQSTGRLGTFVNHFRAGKAMAGLGRAFVAHDKRKRWCARGAISLTPSLTRPVWRLGRERPEFRRDVHRLSPLVIGLALSGTAGFVAGALGGAGHSAARLA